MKRPVAFILALSVSGIAPSLEAAHAATAVAVVRVDVAVVAKGYRTTELVGRDVYNDKNEKIGSLDDIMISQDGTAMFGIVQVGSFLGLGGHLVAVPYKSLAMKDSEKKIVLPGASKQSLGALTEFKYSH